VRIVLLVFASIGAVLLVLLAAATGNTSLFARQYTALVALNVLVGLALLLLVGYQLFLLARALRKRRFGARLTLRLVILFCLMAILPGALVYTVSVQFLGKSIESWFDVRVDSALEGGLNLGRSMLDNMLDELSRKANTAALDLAGLQVAQYGQATSRLRDQLGANEVLILGAQGQVIMSATRDVTRLAPDAPSTSLLRQARQNRGYRAVESVGERGLNLRVLVPLPSFSLIEEPRMLQLTQAVPPALAASAESVQSVHRAYRELQASRSGLREIYIFALTLTLLLTLFAAFSLAFILGGRLSEPLAALAESTEAVARGDFSRRTRVTSADELGTLTASFNSMTAQLDEARRTAERTRLEVENAKAHLENVLANLSTGVLVLDKDQRLAITNAGAERILGASFPDYIGQQLALVPGLGRLAESVTAGFEEAGDAAWTRQVELIERGQALVLRGSRLPVAAGADFVVVFDDVTALIQAQRATAWAEVAQRLAHEIKNPLTPIQLAAERLKMKLSDRLSVEDEQTLSRATDTIVAQVTAMKDMVDEFRVYARLPAPKLEPIEVNAVISEILTLYEHARSMIYLDLAPDLPRVAGDRSQLRQVVHNLLQNAQDALSSVSAPRIEIRTEHNSGTPGAVRLTISDNGSGFPDGLIKRVFEPYVTSKPKGTGLGLAIVKKVIDEHHGTVAVVNLYNKQNDSSAAAPCGAQVSITLPALSSYGAPSKPINKKVEAA
jgi:nitrogen fixation/metabolism regulation signal transduction histidine kinase